MRRLSLSTFNRNLVVESRFRHCLIPPLLTTAAILPCGPSHAPSRSACTKALTAACTVRGTYNAVGQARFSRRSGSHWTTASNWYHGRPPRLSPKSNAWFSVDAPGAGMKSHATPMRALTSSCVRSSLVDCLMRQFDWGLIENHLEPATTYKTSFVALWLCWFENFPIQRLQRIYSNFDKVLNFLLFTLPIWCLPQETLLSWIV